MGPEYTKERVTRIHDSAGGGGHGREREPRCRHMTGCARGKEGGSCVRQPSLCTAIYVAVARRLLAAGSYPGCLPPRGPGPGSGVESSTDSSVPVPAQLVTVGRIRRGVPHSEAGWCRISIRCGQWR